MELNSIRLPASVVADLYKDTLVETENEQKIIPVQGMEQLIFLGNNKKNILICVKYPSVLHLPDEQLTFLVTMLTACKLTLSDIAIVNLKNFTDQSYKKIINKFKPGLAFLFGIEPAAFGLPVNFPAYQLQPFNNCSFLYAPSLDELGSDKLLKSKLWVCLRKIFSI
jgi:hypothetical protein